MELLFIKEYLINLQILSTLSTVEYEASKFIRAKILRFFLFVFMAIFYLFFF